MPTITGIMYSDNFYPRSPCGERPSVLKPCAIKWQFLSTLSLRRATNHHIDAVRYAMISIHALLAESDKSNDNAGGQADPISIHALLAESDAALLAVHHVSDNFYPRSPCGERRRRNTGGTAPP